jgi:uncharacterized membrane protein
MSATPPGTPGFELLLKRNCSITPRAVIWLLAATAAFSFAIGVAFAWHGLWMVLPFAGVEMIALAAAFYVNGRHASDYERFALAAHTLEVEVSDAGRVSRHRFNPEWVRVVLGRSPRHVRVALAAQGRELEVGRHLSDAGRALLGRELRAQLAAARTISRSGTFTEQ